MAEFLDRLGLPRDGDTVLDIGCGPGAMVPHFRERLGGAGKYVGFDTHGPSIQWCCRNFAGDSRLSFHHADCSGTQNGAVLKYKFSVADGAADLVLAKSVFTHLLEPVARHYLLEIHRTLRRGGAAVITAFLFDDTGPGKDAVRDLFPQAEAAGAIRWRSRLRPTAAVAYSKSRFTGMVEGAGLRLQWMSNGFFPGCDRLLGQDTLLIGH
jgi:ubiquinone/menaquinone biosynthesis C-methylase UbiE